MFIRLSAALVALAVLCVGPARAHEGHDHGAATPSLPAQNGPRAEARSSRYELVAISHGGNLVLYLDRFATNEPVAGARLDVATPDGVVQAEAEADGTYRLPAPWIAKGGHRDLSVTVTVGGASQTLALPLDLPSAALVVGTMPTHGVASALVGEIREHVAHQAPIGAAAVGFLLGLATITLMRARLAVPAFALLALTVSLLIGGAALAHEEHEEPDASGSPGPAMRGAAPVDAAPIVERSRRLPDGAIFVPKSAQRLLSVRTDVTAAASHRQTVELPGRIIPDPNASGVVQSSVGGRLSPPPDGFPNLGARVKKGDLLATVTPPVQAVDASDMRQTQGDLDQQIAIVARRVARYEKLAPSGIVAQTALDDAKAELGGLKDRRAALDAIRREPEALTSPIDGVVSERSAVAGQMASPGAMVFRILDPDRLYVEALSFEALEPEAQASARLADGRVLALTYKGAGLADREQAVPVQFSVQGDTKGLRMGQFATVLAPVGRTSRGLAVPRSGVVRSEGGSVVYEKVSAERFEARPVRIEPLDGERVIVAEGLKAGRRVVVQGAELIDQVR